MARKRSSNQGRSSDIARISEIQRMQMESRRISARLANHADLARQLESAGANPKREIAEMQKRRTDLTRQLREASKDTRLFANLNLIKDRRLSALIDIGDILWPWAVLPLPTMEEGVDDPPGTSDSDGDIGTAGLFQGAGAFGGMPGCWGPKERWWVHNWTCTAVLPAPTSQGSMSYKFGAGCEASVYHVEGVGTLSSFVTIGTTSDVNVPITNWQTVGWPFFQVPMPPTGFPLISGGVEVVGNIPTAVGKSPAVTIIIGVIVSVIDGYIMFLPTSNFAIGLLGTSGYMGVGKIQYRFNPEWVVQGVNEAVS